MKMRPAGGIAAEVFSAEEVGRWRSEHAPDYWAHWVLKSTRRERMVEWYRTVFGARVVFTNERLTFMTWDQEHHRVAIIRMPWAVRLLAPLQGIRRKLLGLDHLAFNFGTLQRLLETYERIKQAGISPVWCINHGPTTSIYYEDPDGNRLEFQFENFDRVEDLQAFAASGEFADNPIGVNFDPDYLLERLRGGTPPDELKTRGSGTRPGARTVGGMKAITWKTL
ncbi:MAG: VOC family protein [Pseudomonadota bacterium]|nr:VOC family protein [Pseudomonadota bacterium]